MDLGIIGLEQSGKAAVFDAVTRGHASAASFGSSEPNIGVVKIPDERLDRLCDVLKDAARRIPTHQFVPDPRDTGHLVLAVPGAPQAEDPLATDTPQSSGIGHHDEPGCESGPSATE